MARLCEQMYNLSRLTAIADLKVGLPLLIPSPTVHRYGLPLPSTVSTSAEISFLL